MRAVVTGATGNVGTAVVRALAARPEVDAVVGLARRRPTGDVEGVEWVAADIRTGDLARHFRGADLVIHLAWLIQPSHDETVQWEVNVEGSSRVFAAAVDAGVGALVYASSVGAYSPGPKDRFVDEAWPTHGVATSAYSRQKAYVERLLDALERDHPDLRVVRLRPGLVFQSEAATEIRRYFAGPYFPRRLVHPRRLGIIPVIPGVVFQAVHSADLATAYCLAGLGSARGAFNIAAEPPLSLPGIAGLVKARRVAVPPAVARAAVAASWRLHLQPTDPGWLDLARAVPLLDTTRARTELGWAPVRSGSDALLELLTAMAAGEGVPTPPLQADSLAGRLSEVRSGTGSRTP